MCGRYSLTFDDEYDREIADIVAEIGEKYHQSDVKTGEIFPTNTAPVLIRQGCGISPVPCRWGFPGFRGRGVIINARAETAAEKKTFRESLFERRCVIPSSGFYEWDKSKQKYRFNMQSGNALYMAGFYNFFSDGPRFVILTSAANQSISGIHHRMPLVLEKGNIKEWITDSGRTSDILHETPPALRRKAV